MARRNVYSLIGLGLLALALRLWGVAFGLPYVYHPDEPAFVLQALAVARGLPHGLTFANPPLFKYILFLEYAGAYLVGSARGAFSSPQDFVHQFRADPSLLYLIARTTSAFAGAATVLASFALASRVRGARAGLLAAAFTAVSFLLVRDAHFGVNDALVTLLTTLALYASIRVLQSGTRGDYLLAGTTVGLAFSCKYTGAIVSVQLLLAHCLARRRRPALLILSLAAACISALATFPALILEPSRVAKDVYFRNYLPGQVGYDGLDPAGGYVYYIKVLVWGVGAPAFLAALVGILDAAIRRDRLLLVVVSLPFLLYAIMGSERMYFSRFVLPAIPALLVLSATAVDSIAHWADQRLGKRQHALTLAAMALVLVAPTLVKSLRFDSILTQEDTRTAAREWIETQLPSGAHIALDDLPFAPVLPSKGLDVLIARDRPLHELTWNEYARLGVEYVLTSSYVFDRALLDRARDEQRLGFYAELARRGKLLAEFSPCARGARAPAFVYDQLYAPLTEIDRLQRPGPTLNLYRISSE